ncbi:MAG TPA: hypothetical protein VI457_00335 [Methylococcaceae bacterium]|nr:hypothetical protein [Methylococcaceae bacterium]
MLQGSGAVDMNDANLLSAREADRVGNFDATLRRQLVESSPTARRVGFFQQPPRNILAGPLLYKAFPALVSAHLPRNPEPGRQLRIDRHLRHLTNRRAASHNRIAVSQQARQPLRPAVSDAALFSTI